MNSSLRRALADAAYGVGYRNVFVLPNLGRMLDIERTVLYLATIACTLAIAQLPTVIVPMIVLCLIGVSFSGSRLARRRDPVPLPSMMVDLVLVAIMAPIALPQPWAALIILAFLMVEFVLLDITVRDYSIVAGIVGVPHLFASLIAVPPAASFAVRVAASSLIIGVSMAVMVVFALRSRELSKELLATEAKLSTVVSTAPVAIGSIRANGTIASWVGERALEFGTDPVGMPHRTAFEEVAGLSDLIDLATIAGIQRGEVSHDGRSYQVTTTPVGSSSAPEVALVAFDVTEQVEARKRLEDVVAEKDRFIATVSHELRTPLTAIIGFGEALEASLLDAGPELADLASILTAQGRNMAFMVEDLLVAARADFGRIKVRSELVDLGSTVDQVVSALSDQLDGHTLTVDIDDAEAIGDSTRVGQIIRNLVTNAGRYGGPAVVITTRTRDGLSTVEVADNGPPIPDDERELIFQPYERSTARTAHPNSIGLGLSVCRKLARLMGGNVEYHHDGWSRFVLTLPAAPGVESQVEPVEAPA